MANIFDQFDTPAAFTTEVMPFRDAPEEPVSQENVFDQFDVSTPEFTPVESAVRGGVEGITFGFVDELEGLKAAAFAKLSGDDRPFMEIFSNVQEFFQERGNQAEEQNPKSFLAGELGGGLLTAGGLAKTGATLVGKTVGKGLLKRTAAGATEGAGIGALVGAGTSEGDVVDRLEGAGKGATLGGLLGGVIPVAGKAISATAGGVVRPIAAKLNPQGTAVALVGERLRNAQTSVERALKRLNEVRKFAPNATFADVGGTEVQTLLRAAANVPSEARAGLLKRLSVRQQFQFRRLADALGVAAEGSPDEFFEALTGMANMRKATAQKMFDAAFRKSLPFTPKLQKILQRPLLRAALGRAQVAAQNRGDDLQGIFAQEVGRDVDDIPVFELSRVPGVEDIHRVKMELDNIIDGLKRGRETGLKNVQVRDVVIAKQDLLSAINVPEYKAALKQYAGDSAVLNAARQGIEDGLKMTPEEIASAMKNFSDAEKRVFRMGFARALVDKIRNRPVQNDAVKTVLENAQNIERMKQVFPNATRRTVQRVAAIENLQTRTFRTVQGNSTTTQQLLENQNAANFGPSDIAAVGADVAAGGAPVATVSNAARRAITQRMGDRLKGLSPDVANEIIRLMTTPGGESIKTVSEQLAKLSLAERRALTVQDLAIIGLSGPAATVATQAAAAE